MTQSIADKVVARIYGKSRGWAFSQIDFSDLGSREAIDMALFRLHKKSTIRRVIRGLYDYPRYSQLLEREMGPDIHQVARALARKFGWRIQPSGTAAMNLLGLSTQVPSQYLYQSDGPNRHYEACGTAIQFKHGTLKDAGFRHDESGLIVQSLKTLGETHITDETISRARQWLPVDKRTRVLKDTQRVTGWVHEVIKQICREDSDG